MKKFMIVALSALCLFGGASAANAGSSFHVSVGTPVVGYAAPRPYYDPYAYYAPRPYYAPVVVHSYPSYRYGYYNRGYDRGRHWHSRHQHGRW